MRHAKTMHITFYIYSAYTQYEYWSNAIWVLLACGRNAFYMFMLKVTFKGTQPKREQRIVSPSDFNEIKNALRDERKIIDREIIATSVVYSI